MYLIISMVRTYRMLCAFHRALLSWVRGWVGSGHVEGVAAEAPQSDPHRFEDVPVEAVVVPHLPV